MAVNPRDEIQASELFERADEVRLVEQALGAARAGSGALLLIEGPGGIGKTALLTAARRLATDNGMRVAAARGSELERELAFGVVRQLLEATISAAEPAARRELFSGAAGLAEPLFQFETAGSAGRDQAFTIVHGLYWLCSNLVQDGPLLMAVDDAHWADLASLRFLAYLAPRLEGLPLALAVATRPSETPAEEEVLVALASDPRCITISPAPLSRDAIAALLRAELDQDPENPFVDASHTATGGTPFLVRELARELRTLGLEPIAASADRVADLGPRTIARSVVARVRRIAPEALTLARAAAVLGGDAEPRHLARLARIAPAEATRQLDGLVGAGVLAPGRPLEFVHPIVRSAIYADIPSGERARLHECAAELLAEHGVDEERVAGHLLMTDPSGDQHTVELLVRTAGAAVIRGAPASAASYLARALAEPPDAGSRADVLHRLGVAEIHAGRLPAACEHLDDAYRSAGEHAPRTAIALDLAAAFSIQGRFPAAAQLIADVLQDPGGLDGDEVLALRADLLMMATLGPPSLYAEVEERLGRLDGDVDGASPGARKYLAALTVDAAVRRARPAAEVRELAERALRAGIVEELGSGAIAWSQAIHITIGAGAFELGEQLVSDALEYLSRQPSVVGYTRTYMARAFLHLRRGGVREALADARTSLDMGREIGFSGWPHGLAVLVEALVEQGDADAAETALVETGMAGEIPHGFMPNDRVLESRARLRLVQGRPEEAVADLEELARRIELRGLFNPSFYDHRTGLALALLRTGDRDRAAAMAKESLELYRPWGAPREVGIALRTAGLCERGEPGLALLRESVATLEGSGARLEHARSLVELGAAIRRAGNRAEAREPLQAAMERAHACGAPPLVEQAREELMATGARPRRIMRTGVDALTPSELRVARMAAQGMTNREIAQALFVTARTVETHLTQTFRKLDIASRDELTQRLSCVKSTLD